MVAKRDSEFVADFAAYRAQLHKPKMVGIAGLPTATETRLRGDEIEVLLVADPPRPLWLVGYALQHFGPYVRHWYARQTKKLGRTPQSQVNLGECYLNDTARRKNLSASRCDFSADMDRRNNRRWRRSRAPWHNYVGESHDRCRGQQGRLCCAKAII
jgi:hypothetical protein